MKLLKFILLLMSLLVLASCGGGGACGASVAFGSVASSTCDKKDNILSKYAGNYFQCNDPVKTRLALSVTGDKSLNYIIIKDTYSAPNCSGSLVTSDSAEGVVTFVGTGLANLPVENIFPYAAVIDVMSMQDDISGIYLSADGQYISLFSLINGVLSAERSDVYSKDPSFNVTSLQSR